MAIPASEQAGIMVLNYFILGLGAFFDIVGLLLWTRRIPQNRCIGVKISAMGTNKDIWYEVNEYAGRWITIEGMFLLLLAFIFLMVPPAFNLLGRSLTFVALFLLSAGFVFFICIQRAKAFSAPVYHRMGAFDQL